MKKIILILIFLLIIPLTSSATSGTCSSHGGVNCAVSNGFSSITCNDGTTDSSTSFYSLDECKYIPCNKGSISAIMARNGMIGSPSADSILKQCDNFNNNLEQSNSIYTPPANLSSPTSGAIVSSCFYVTPYGCNSESDYQRKSEQFKKEIDDCNFHKQLGWQISTDCPTIGQSELVACREEINDNKILRDAYENCLNRASQNNAEEEVVRQMNEWCFSHVGSQSFYDKATKICACNSGFIKVNGLCRNSEQVKYDEQQKLELEKKIEEAFAKEFNSVLEFHPEYKGVIDREKIKALTLKPENSKKTFLDIIKEAYPNVKPVVVEKVITPVKEQPKIVNTAKPIIVEQKDSPKPVIEENNPKEEPVIQEIKPIVKENLFGRVKQFFTNIFKFKWF